MITDRCPNSVNYGMTGLGLGLGFAFFIGRTWLNWSGSRCLEIGALSAVAGMIVSVLQNREPLSQPGAPERGLGGGTAPRNRKARVLPAPIDVLSMQRGKTRFVIRYGDITKENAEAIVNAANCSLMGGSGVDGAIHRAAGPGLLNECRALQEASPGIRCPTGEARLAGSHNLAQRGVKHIILTAGPVWDGQADLSQKQAKAVQLKQCYMACLKLAKQKGLKTLAFCSIGTGIYGYPLSSYSISWHGGATVDIAAPRIALDAISEFIDNNPEAFHEIRMDVLAPRDILAYGRESQRRTNESESSWRLDEELHTSLVQLHVHVLKLPEAWQVRTAELAQFMRDNPQQDLLISDFERCLHHQLLEMEFIEKLPPNTLCSVLIQGSETIHQNVFCTSRAKVGEVKASVLTAIGYGSKPNQYIDEVSLMINGVEAADNSGILSDLTDVTVALRAKDGFPPIRPYEPIHRMIQQITV